MRALHRLRHQLHEAMVLVDLHVLVNAKANLVDVERFRAVNLGHRAGDQFETPIHFATFLYDSDSARTAFSCSSTPTPRWWMLTSASSFRRVVTETTLTISRRTGRGQPEQKPRRPTTGVPDRSDPVQTEIISGWNAAAGPIANRVVGTITADLTRSPSRDTESTLANRIADTQLAATAAADGGSHIASMNLGRVRADLTFSQISGGSHPAR